MTHSKISSRNCRTNILLTCVVNRYYALHIGLVIKSVVGRVYLYARIYPDVYLEIRNEELYNLDSFLDTNQIKED
jgi:hypothetical protein